MDQEGGELLERSDELARMRAHLAAAAEGHGSTTLVEARAGLGKTSFLAAVAAAAAASEFAVLSAAAGVLETDLAWNLVRQLFASVLESPAEEQGELLSGAAALAAGPLGLVERRRNAGAMHGLYWLTSRLAQRSPLLIAIDDAHWGDEPSLRYGAYLGERVSDLPIAIVATARAGESQPEALRALAAGPEVDRIHLRPLGVAAGAELVRDRLGPSATDEFCAACHVATGGNPFFLGELVDQLKRDGVEPSSEGAAEVRGVTPDAVARAVLLRLSRLPEAARELAAAVAILGGDTRLIDAAALAGLEGHEAAAAADALVRAGILGPGDALSFAHPILHEVVYHELPPHERARRHHGAARLLADGGAAPERIGSQLLETEPANDGWVLDRLRDAARVAMGAATPASAVAYLERALLEPPAPELRGEVLAELGRAEAAAGSPDAAGHLQEAVEVFSEPRSRAEGLRDLGLHLYVTGRPREAAEAFDRGLAELLASDEPDPSLAAELRAGWLTIARIEVQLRPRATALVAEIAANPPKPRSYGERALLALLASDLTFEGEPRERAIELARLALGEGELIRQETSDGMAWIAAAGALGWGDEFDAYEAVQADALADARRRGSVIGFATASYGLNFTHYHRGMLSDAIADAEQAIAAERDGWGQFLPAARAQLAWALIARGELERAEAELARARSDPSWEGSSMQALVLEAESRLHLARGDMRAARDAALGAGRILNEALMPNPSLGHWRVRAAIASVQLGELDRAEELVEDALRRARRFGAPRPLGVVLTAAGLTRGGEAGLSALEESVEVLTDSPARLEHARALLLLGIALRRRGSIKSAREVLRSALDACTACGATALEERAKSELVAAGGRPRRRRSSGVESLTPGELRVAELAADGMSNREIAESLFVSLRTVETHLTHTYRKLDIESRNALAAALDGAER